MFHDGSKLQYVAIQEKSHRDKKESKYEVVFEPVFLPLYIYYREPQVASFGLAFALEPFVAAAWEAVDLGLTLWPLIVYSWMPTNVHNVPLLRHRSICQKKLKIYRQYAT